MNCNSLYCWVLSWRHHFKGKQQCFPFLFSLLFYFNTAFKLFGIEDQLQKLGIENIFTSIVKNNLTLLIKLRLSFSYFFLIKSKQKSRFFLRNFSLYLVYIKSTNIASEVKTQVNTFLHALFRWKCETRLRKNLQLIR